jgi:hypothetical protein
MAHYAYLDSDSIVTQVIRGKQEDEGDTDWEAYYGAVRTSYNTHGGQHATGGTPFRYNYAGNGYTFDPDHGTHGAFIPPQPYPSWTLNADTALWDAPTPMPAEGMWSWDEDTLAWLESAI